MNPALSRTVPLLLLVSGCLEGTKPPATPRSLYDRLGGEPGITKVVDDFVANVIADPNYKDRHKKHFLEGDVAGLKRKLIDQIGQATGGPQKYTGKGMREAHAGLGITDADFDTLVADLTSALNNNGVAKKDQDELLTMLGGMRHEIVEKGPARGGTDAPR